MLFCSSLEFQDFQLPKAKTKLRSMSEKFAIRLSRCHRIYEKLATSSAQPCTVQQLIVFARIDASIRSSSKNIPTWIGEAHSEPSQNRTSCTIGSASERNSQSTNASTWISNPCSTSPLSRSFLLIPDQPPAILAALLDRITRRAWRPGDHTAQPHCASRALLRRPGKGL